MNNPALFQGKYRIASARCQKWDYRSAGAYFITICTKNRYHYFGKIKSQQMHLSRIGVIADILWQEIPFHNPGVRLGEFVVMPNHIHGILLLDGSARFGGNNIDCGGGCDGVETFYKTSLQTDEIQTDEIQTDEIQTDEKNEFMASISPKSGSVSLIIRSYKSAVTKHCNRLGFNFAWQTRFHDIIIRNNQSFHTISNYIQNNPKKWKNDCFWNPSKT